MKVIIAGAGYVGTTLARQLVEEGHEVLTVTRSGTSIAGTQSIAADLCEPSIMDLVPNDIEAILYTASASGQRKEAAYRAVYVEGLRHMMQVAQQAPGFKRFIFTSSTAVYHQSHGESVDETSPAAPKKFNGRILLEAEQLLTHSGLSSVVVRLSGIYGPSRDRMIRRVRDGEGTPHRPPPEFLNHIHRDDAAALLAHLLTLKNPHPLYMGSDSEPAPYNDVTHWLAERLEVPAPPRPNEWRGSKRCSNLQLLQSGFHFTFPTYREGYEAIITETTP